MTNILKIMRSRSENMRNEECVMVGITGSESQNKESQGSLKGHLQSTKDISKTL